MEQQKYGKKKEEDDLVRDTAGGEMPDPGRKPAEKAADAAEVFKSQKQKSEKAESKP